MQYWKLGLYTFRLNSIYDPMIGQKKKKNSPKELHVLIPRICNYVMLPDKEQLR